MDGGEKSLFVEQDRSVSETGRQIDREHLSASRLTLCHQGKGNSSAWTNHSDRATWTSEAREREYHRESLGGDKKEKTNKRSRRITKNRDKDNITSWFFSFTNS